ncbi:sugar phosphate isomerase/epimerase [Blautia liquoris]|uniref:Sugar phosphate isomerase/epimerase n=1 Tax=Blautia liquoris TaxID=2779518 RepID=A0A7M2RJJ2_9FIRM|nr:sugar phosphate isomerase/epimerase family protein [Blautia liquoris]QOV20429.1 sugar phosphate isomerase/epimerase [Blautia liquoris]
MKRHVILTGFTDELADSFDEQITGAKKNGLTHIEIRAIDGKNIADCSKHEIEKAKQKLDTAGIKVSTIGSPIGKIDIKEPFEKHFNQYQKMVEYAKLFDTPYIRMFSFYMPEGEDKYSYEDEVMERLSRLVDYAADQDVILLHENEKKIFGDDARGCKKIMERFYGDHLKAIFDFANFVECGQDTLEAYEILKDYVSYIHIKDAQWDSKLVVPAGMGDGNVQEILRQLKAKNFEGFLSLEPHLTHFSGIKKLEDEDAHSTDKERLLADRPFAFDIAVHALKAILWDLDWA